MRDYTYTPGTSGLFSVAVPEGNYRVTVRLGDERAATETTIKAESRRLMLDAVRVARGGTATRSFIVNVRDARIPPPPLNAPGGDAVRLNDREAGSFTWDDKLTLEILGTHPGVRAIRIEPVELPTVFLLGDSTVTDQRYEPGASWGQMLPAFFRPDIAIANHAESGETMKSFLTALRLDKVLSLVKPGDFALIQFGHNDQKETWPQTYAEAATTYRSYLRSYIAEFRRRGAVPILVTPPDRRNWTADNRIRSTLTDYVAAIKAVAVEEHVPLVDLNAASIAFYEALGPARAPLAFSADGKDATHHDNYGAWALARAVAEQLKTVEPALGAHLASDVGTFDPSRPIPPDLFRLSPSAARSDVQPRGN